MESNYLHLPKNYFIFKSKFKMYNNTKKIYVLITFYLLTTSIFITAQDQVDLNDQLNYQNIDYGEFLSLTDQPDDIKLFISDFFNTPDHGNNDPNIDSINFPANLHELNQNEPVQLLNNDYQLDNSLTENELLNVLLNNLNPNLPNSKEEINDNIVFVNNNNDQIISTEVPFIKIEEEKPEPIYIKFLNPIVNSSLVNLLSNSSTISSKLSDSMKSTSFATWQKNHTNLTKSEHSKNNYLNSTIVSKGQATLVENSQKNITVTKTNFITMNSSSNTTSLNKTINATTTKPTSNSYTHLNNLNKQKYDNNNWNGNLKGYFNIQSFDEIYDIDSLPGQKPSLIGKGRHVVEKRVHMEPMAKSLSTKGKSFVQ